VSERYAPEDPREWLNRARSNLVLARMQGEGVYLEDLCFNTQQAVEKAIKALLIQRHIQFPYVHDIAELLTVLEEAGQESRKRSDRQKGSPGLRSLRATPVSRRRSAGRSIRKLYT
jgi:HEPN domain-containing protein